MDYEIWNTERLGNEHRTVDVLFAVRSRVRWAVALRRSRDGIGVE